jgi:hypothetical protein
MVPLALQHQEYQESRLRLVQVMQAAQMLSKIE